MTEALTILLIMAAVLGGLAGLAFASDATIGVAIVAFACLLGIFARIAQSAHQHQKK